MKEPETESEVFEALVGEYFMILQDREDGSLYVEAGLDELKEFIDNEFPTKVEQHTEGVKPERPKFESIPHYTEYDGFTHKQDFDKNSAFVDGCNYVYDEYVKQLQERNAELQEENARLKEAVKELTDMADQLAKESGG